MFSEWVHLVNTWVLFCDYDIIISKIDWLAASLKTWVLIDWDYHMRLFRAAYAGLRRVSKRTFFFSQRVHDFDWTWICRDQVGPIHTLQHIQTIHFYFVI